MGPCLASHHTTLSLCHHCIIITLHCGGVGSLRSSMELKSSTTQHSMLVGQSMHVRRCWMKQITCTGVSTSKRWQHHVMLLLHHHCLATSSHVIINPSSFCVNQMTTNNQSVIVHRLVATSPCDVAPELCV